jgi:hypothetical protein
MSVVEINIPNLKCSKAFQKSIHDAKTSPILGFETPE